MMADVTSIQNRPTPGGAFQTAFAIATDVRRASGARAEFTARERRGRRSHRATAHPPSASPRLRSSEVSRGQPRSAEPTMCRQLAQPAAAGEDTDGSLVRLAGQADSMGKDEKPCMTAKHLARTS